MLTIARPTLRMMNRESGGLSQMYLSITGPKVQDGMEQWKRL